MYDHSGNLQDIMYVYGNNRTTNIGKYPQKCLNMSIAQFRKIKFILKYNRVPTNPTMYFDQIKHLNKKCM